MNTTPMGVLDFWREAGPKRWFSKDPAFDAEFRERFLHAHEAAARGELRSWADTADGALATLILLDQFPRNAFRGSAGMFATDALALHLAHDAIAAGLDTRVEPDMRNFFYLPLMHAEDLREQQRAVALTLQLGGDPHRFAVMHSEIIKRFGRFPHRNALLGRTSSAEEVQFLTEGGFAG